jgi:hypothetical protein
MMVTQLLIWAAPVKGHTEVALVLIAWLTWTSRVMMVTQLLIWASQKATT